MSFLAEIRGARGRRASGRLAVLAVVCLAFVAGVGVIAANATTARIMGETGSKPGPMCSHVPGAPCSVEGHVTGFQRRLKGEGGVFTVKQDGQIVAWSVRMGNPVKEDRQDLGTLTQTTAFGKKPTGGLAILKPLDDATFRLKSKSPIVYLHSYYGRDPLITLEQPLKVRAGDVVGLTIPTWLPVFRGDIGKPADAKKNSWRGSRLNGECDPSDFETVEEFLKASKPQTKIDSERKYGCIYKGGRLFYTAYFVPS